MNNDYFSADAEILFNEKTEEMQNTRNVKIYSIIEDNTFRLVRNYMGGQFDHSNDTEWALAILATSIKNDVDDIYKLEIDRIKEKLDKVIPILKSKDIAKQLNDKYKSLVCEYYNYVSINKAKTEKEFKGSKALLCTSERILKYLIIELKGALGMDFDSLSNNNEISNYCEAIINDVNNNKYKRLSIEEHFTSKGYLNPYK